MVSDFVDEVVLFRTVITWLVYCLRKANSPDTTQTGRGYFEEVHPKLKVSSCLTMHPRTERSAMMY